MKMKNSTIVQLIGNAAFGHAGALNSVHGATTVLRNAAGDPVIDPSGKVMLDQRPHKIAGKVRLALAANMLKLAPAGEIFEKARHGIVSEYVAACKADGSEWSRKHPKNDECQARMRELLTEEQDVPDLVRIAASDLKLDENDIDPAVLVALEPVLDLDK